MWLSRYLFYFTIFSVGGWIYESIFVSLKAKKWENRGFLYGPVVPIYGVGGAALMILVDVLNMVGFEYRWWHIFLFGFFGSFVLEYVTHWALEKLFHAYWWDYHYMPLNIKGRVCLPYTICFALAGLLGVYVLIPFFLKITTWISPILFELFALIFVALMAMDTALTVSALSDFSRKVAAAEEAFNERMSARVDSLMEGLQEAKESAEEFKFANVVSDIQKMGGLSKSALKRVKGFSHPKIEKNRLDEILEAIKRKVPKR